MKNLKYLLKDFNAKSHNQKAINEIIKSLERYIHINNLDVVIDPLIDIINQLSSVLNKYNIRIIINNLRILLFQFQY